ncbi:MAG: hypothetical protein SFY66_01620 [Oculatellaceae cyanobacterium bins.114]|nr:hypothetical protein [Oculatellaceae cyanobacterium bins.114]
MSEPIKKVFNQESNKEEAKTSDRPIEETASHRIVDPLDLVSTTSFNRDPHEIIKNPAVTPKMLDGHNDLRDALKAED